MGSRPDGWWRDRAGAAVRLYADVAELAASGQAVLSADPPDFIMVLEGPRGPRRPGLSRPAECGW